MPPATKEPLQFIDLADFTPGIFADWQSGGSIQAAPDGAAQLTGTYGCVASPSGGLMPGPAIAYTFGDQATLITGVTPFNAAHYPVDVGVHMIAMRNLASISGLGLGGTESDTPDDTFVMWQAYTTATPGTTNIFVEGVLREYQMFAGGAFPSANTIKTISRDTGSKTPGVLNTYGNSSIDLTRANVAQPTQGGSVEIAVGYLASFFTNGAFASGNYVYPDNATPTVVSTANFGTIAGFVLAHQDRILTLKGPDSTSTFEQFPGAITASTEFIGFSGPNDYTNNAGRLLVVNENPSGYGTWVSMNANQLFLIKHVGGGVSITGPMETPTVTRMPGVASTLGLTNRGTIIPNGTYIYGTRYGVFAWSGGDTAQNISEQLTGRFWVPPFAASRVQYISSGNNPPVSPVAGMVGSFAYANPYVYAPNNFLYDTRTNGWWKLGLPSTPSYAFYDVGGGGLMIAGVEQITASNFTDVLHYYDNNTGQALYSWTSQPLARSRGRYTEIRTVDVEAIGTGLITITGYGIDGSTDVQNVTVSSGRVPQLFAALPFHVKGTDIVVAVTASSGTTAPAPRINRISLGYYEAETARGG